MTKRMLLAGIALAVSGVAFPAIASAQAAPEEIVVTGNYGRVSDSIRTLSQSVSYADLDLSTKAGRDEMQHRLKLTARFLCDKLGENSAGDSLAPSCRDAAVQDANKRLGTIEASFAPRGTTWVAPPAWPAPYPVDWRTRYP
ncbi:UrcA family protein [Novosphingobium sp. G106]|uniref:UrcA family protein n=1 Tax=Novosphingobium sp. G106 TaxID=2849500 RepID=UPI001C2DD391|nr:UrcA family protein [Novosphingobium sp. G106]MBV1688463.1 UrcA family protein [Novosphingobium sp. G106]